MSEEIVYLVKRTSPHNPGELRLELPPDYADWLAFRRFALNVGRRGQSAGTAWASVQNVCIGQGPTEYSPLDYLADPDVQQADRNSVRAVSLTSVANRLVSSRMIAEAWPRCSSFSVALIASLALDQCVDAEAVERLEGVVQAADVYPVPRRGAVDRPQAEKPQPVAVSGWPLRELLQ